MSPRWRRRIREISRRFRDRVHRSPLHPLTVGRVPPVSFVLVPPRSLRRGSEDSPGRSSILLYIPYVTFTMGSKEARNGRPVPLFRSSTASPHCPPPCPARVWQLRESARGYVTRKVPRSSSSREDPLRVFLEDDASWRGVVDADAEGERIIRDDQGESRESRLLRGSLRILPTRVTASD